jgi:hypothetical protein
MQHIYCTIYISIPTLSSQYYHCTLIPMSLNPLKNRLTLQYLQLNRRCVDLLSASHRPRKYVQHRPVTLVLLTGLQQVIA